MRGHEALIAMRMSGLVPKAVYIDAGDPTFIVADWPKACPQFAHLSISDSEPVSSLDLRCVVGLCVQVSSDDPGRLSALVDACRNEAAGRVVGVLVRRTWYRSDLVEVSDTEEVLTWQTS